MPPKGFANNETGYIKWIKKDEIDLLLSSLNKQDLQWKLMIYIMVFMGLRRGEVARLKWSDIIGDYERLRVVLYKQKGKIIERVIPEKVREIFRIYEFSWKRFQSGNYIFEPRKSGGSKNKHISPDTITVKIGELRKKAGLNDWYFQRKEGRKLARISPHTFRHYFITKFYEQSKDIVLTQRVIGHKKIETTANYIFNHLERESEFVNAI